MLIKLLFFILYIFNSFIFSSESSSSSSLTEVSPDKSSSSSSSENLFSEKEQKIIDEIIELIIKGHRERELENWKTDFLKSNINEKLIALISINNTRPPKDNYIDALKLFLQNFKVDLNKIIKKKKFGNKIKKIFPLEGSENQVVHKLLIKYGANVNQQDEEGNSLLLRQLNDQSVLPNIQFIETLLRAGADPNIPNDSGESFASKLEKSPVLDRSANLDFRKFTSNERLKQSFADIKKILVQVQNERKQLKEKIMQTTPLPSELVNIILDLAPEVPASTSSSSSSSSSIP